MISLLAKHAKDRPNQIALKWLSADGSTYDSITYEKFAQKISRIATSLKKLGIKRGDRVVIFTPFSIDLYISMFSVQQIGAIAVFLDSWARRDHLSVCANIAKPKGMISFAKAFTLCQDIPELASIPVKIVLDTPSENLPLTLEKLAETPIESEIEEVDGKETALITFTTGSSGNPKGANRTHNFLIAQHKALTKILPFKLEDSDLPIFPIFALNNLASGILTLLPAIDLATPKPDDAKSIAKQILLNQLTSCTLSPSIFIKLATYALENELSFPSLSRVITGGAPVCEDHVRAFQTIAPKAEIMILYGSTEVEPIAHIEGKEMFSKGEGVDVGIISEDLEYKFIKISKEPIVLGDLGWSEWEIPLGSAGEIVVSGPHVCDGYYNDKEAFYKSKIQDSEGKTWHRTGDIGKLDTHGHLWFLGRVHNTILRNGEFLFPVQAEIALKRLPFVKQAAFLGLADQKLGERTCAVVSLKEEVNPTEAIINELTKLNIHVDEVQVVQEIPMDPRHHSKVEYSELRRMLK